MIGHYSNLELGLGGEGLPLAGRAVFCDMPWDEMVLSRLATVE